MLIVGLDGEFYKIEKTRCNSVATFTELPCFSIIYIKLIKLPTTVLRPKIVFIRKYNMLKFKILNLIEPFKQELEL